MFGINTSLLFYKGVNKLYNLFIFIDPLFTEYIVDHIDTFLIYYENLNIIYKNDVIQCCHGRQVHHSINVVLLFCRS